MMLCYDFFARWVPLLRAEAEGLEEINVRTSTRTVFVDITRQVQAAVDRMKMERGVVTVYVPHTTAAVTINENADPSVREDILTVLNRIVPQRDPEYRHGEGNSAAHAKASLVGSSVHVPVEGGRLRLGPWQGIFLCEFDGPRERRVWVQRA